MNTVEVATIFIVNYPGSSAWACASTRMPEQRVGHHRPIDCGPLDIERGVVISGELMVTRDTTEFSLAFAVATFGVPTGAASLAGMGRIDK